MMRTTLAMMGLAAAISMPDSCAIRSTPHNWQGALCSTFLQSSGAERELLNSWMLGFVAATNRERPTRQVRLSQAEIEQQTMVFCSQHAADPLPEAAFAIVDAVTSKP